MDYHRVYKDKENWNMQGTNTEPCRNIVYGQSDSQQGGFLWGQNLCFLLVDFVGKCFGCHFVFLLVKKGKGIIQLVKSKKQEHQKREPSGN